MKSTIEELQAFVTIVDSGSIVMAAERLGKPLRVSVGRCNVWKIN